MGQDLLDKQYVAELDNCVTSLEPPVLNAWTSWPLFLKLASLYSRQSSSGLALAITLHHGQAIRMLDVQEVLSNFSIISRYNPAPGQQLGIGTGRSRRLVR